MERKTEHAPELLDERIQILVVEEGGDIHVKVVVAVVPQEGMARRTSWTERRFSEALARASR